MFHGAWLHEEMEIGRSVHQFVVDITQLYAIKKVFLIELEVCFYQDNTSKTLQGVEGLLLCYVTSRTR